MTESEFFARVGDILEVDGPIDASTDLTQLEEYDSLGILNLMILFDEMGTEVTQDDFAGVGTGAALRALAGSKVDG